MYSSLAHISSIIVDKHRHVMHAKAVMFPDKWSVKMTLKHIEKFGEHMANFVNHKSCLRLLISSFVWKKLTIYCFQQYSKTSVFNFRI